MNLETSLVIEYEMQKIVERMWKTFPKNSDRSTCQTAYQGIEVFIRRNEETSVDAQHASHSNVLLAEYDAICQQR